MPDRSPALPSRPAAGWTLLELSTVLAVVALVCLLALPALDGAVTRWRADMLRMQMVTAFNMARNTAITRFQPIAVCPSEDGSSCGQDWSRGWLIYREHAPGSSGEMVGDLLHFQPGTSATAVRAHASADRNRLRFQRDGRSSGSNLTLDICADGILHSQVIVNNTGRTRAARLRQPSPCPL